MNKPSVLQADGIETLVQTYGNMLFRLCLVTLGNASDAEDVVQDTFIKYLQKAPVFESSQHEKAWLIKVATNQCKDILRFHHRHPTVDIDEIAEFSGDTEDHEILDALMTLPDKFRLVLVLYYVEGYRIEDIAKMIGKTTSAVKMRLKKGRFLLKEAYQREEK
ncbi:MAG: RNA polymerase sigma factor [Lachnospiraceae bacterium]|nr:RNA polymerase sigma factor [Lachnospiraceae bacterium]